MSLKRDTSMNKEDNLRFCRFYKGERECPYKEGMKSLLWDYERIWIELSPNKDDMLGNMLDDYLRAGLSEFEMQDDTPISLKSLLFDRYRHWLGGYGDADADAFKKWYADEYIASQK